MNRRIYPKPPIVEAVIGFRFTQPITRAEVAAALAARLSNEYAGDPREQQRFEVSAAVRQDSIATTGRLVPHVRFLQSRDGLRLLGCADGGLSVHVLAPYPGWEVFVDLANHAFNAVRERLAGGLASASVRYIDRIVLPAGGVSFADYITVMPAAPDGMPTNLTGFHAAIQSVDPADNTVATLTLASVPSEAQGHAALLYDLTMERAGAPLCSLDDSRWISIVETLHERQRTVFEASITDRLRELFR